MSDDRLTISGPDGDFSAYVARPAGAAPHPAVVVVQEIFGVNHTMRQVADDLAAEGYLALVPDLFWRFEPGIELDDRKPEELKHAFALFPQVDLDKTVEDIRATLNVARALPDGSGKAGAVGYCLGGSLAYLTACRTDSDATVAYYGISIPDQLDEARALSRPLLLHVAEADRFVPPEKHAAMLSGLREHPQVTLHTYSGVDHAFAREGGENYDAAAAELADRRTREFFGRHLA